MKKMLKMLRNIKSRLFYATPMIFFKLVAVFALILFLCSYFSLLNLNQISQSANLKQIHGQQVNSESFKKIQEWNIINGSNIKPKIVFNAVNAVGYCNRIYAMISTFTIALLTKSAFIMEWPYIKNFFEEPFVKAFGPFEKHGPLGLDHDLPSTCAFDPHTINSWKKEKKILVNHRSIIDFPNCTRYLVDKVAAYWFDLLQIREYADELVKYGYIRKATVDRAFERAQNETIDDRDKIESLHEIGFEYAGNFLKKHWILTQNMQKKLDKIVNDNFEGHFVIGIQARFEFLEERDILTFFKCAHNIEREESTVIGSRKIKYYVSSDKEWIIDRLGHMLNRSDDSISKKVIAIQGVLDNVASDPKAYERAILDVELLARCDRLIVTGGSTFGMIPAIMSQRKPYFVEGKVRMMQCAQLTLHSPAQRPEGYAVF